MRQIEIDDDVYAAMAERAVGFQQPNDVLRALLGLPGTPAIGSPTASARIRKGRLAVLVEAGFILPGDTLSYVQPRTRTRVTATVDALGRVTTKQGCYAEPSPALRDLVGTRLDGWAYWKHDESDRSLRWLRAAHEGRTSWRPPGFADTAPHRRGTGGNEGAALRSS